MTDTPNQTPNPNRRRRLSADESIAIVVALAGIGTVFFWGIGQKYRPLNLLQSRIASSVSSDNANGKVGLLGSDEPIFRSRSPMANVAETQQQTPAPETTTSPAPTVNIVAAPVATTKTTTATKIIVPPTVVIPSQATPVATRPAFTDVTKQFWAATYISELQKRGILDDFGTGKFDPSKPITRGEYAKMLDRAFADKPVKTIATNFKDIPTDYPRKEAIDKSVQIGFMTGYSPTRFAPNQTIPRYQLQISLAKGLQLATTPDLDRVLSKFSDANKMPTYAREKMAAALESGLVIKDEAANNLLKPIQKASRADAAALIYEALVKAGKITPQQPQ